MYQHHLVRVGAMGHVGRFTAVDAVRYTRGSHVIVRTARGLEIGEVLSADGQAELRGTTDGAILRGMTVEDRLLQARLEKHKRAALDACEARLRDLGSPAVLMDVELLFDGRSLYFYFLGEVAPEVEAVTDELASVYEARAQIQQFADAVATGCGPECGTDEAAGCGSSCSSCAISGACSTGSRRQSAVA